MDQRTSVILAALLFAVVVAGSVAYLIYGTGNATPSTSATPTPTQAAQATATPTLFTIATETPFPTILPLTTSAAMTQPTPMAVNATAKTGPEDSFLVLALLTPLLGGAAFVKLARG